MNPETLKPYLKNVAFTTPTPFSQDGSEVLSEKVKANLAPVLGEGGELFIPCGNTGEYFALSHEERIDVVKATCEAIGDEGAVVAGAAGSVPTVLSLADSYRQVGADGLMVMHPNHPYKHEQGLLEYYRTIANRSELPVVIYKRGADLPNSIIAELTTHDHIVGVKYADSNIKVFANVVREADGDVVWINGIAERYAPAFALEGAEGFTTGIGNFVPGPTLALEEAIVDRDWNRAKSLRDVLCSYENLREESGEANLLNAANNIPAVKFGMELAGLYSGPVRAPLVTLSQRDQNRARDYYEEMSTIEAPAGD